MPGDDMNIYEMIISTERTDDRIWICMSVYHHQHHQQQQAFRRTAVDTAVCYAVT